MNCSEGAGPVVWTGIIALTCVLLVQQMLGAVMVAGKALGRLVSDPRLRARHRYGQALRTRQASIANMEL